jgi:hypothetical protein
MSPDINIGAAQALAHMNFDGEVASPGVNFGTAVGIWQGVAMD